MPNAADRFISAAVSPLEDNAELEMAARHALAEAVGRSGEVPGDPLEVVAVRMEEVGGKLRWSGWRIGLCPSTVAVSLIAFKLSGQSFTHYRWLEEFLGGGWIDPRHHDANWIRHLRHLSAEERMSIVAAKRLG